MAPPSELEGAQAKRKLQIKQVRGWAGCPRQQQLVLKGLGLGRPGRSVLREDTPAIRGMLHKVRHLVEVSESAEL